jgi:3-deoxy-manno-octulosonate cytidylyltransferase (CMP-KDO synthetase)
MRTAITSDHLEAAARVRLVVLDVDGVLTDGTLAYTAQGATIERFHARDTVGIRRLRDAGVAVAAVTARASGGLGRFGDDHDIVVRRHRDKLEAVRDLAAERGLELSQLCFVGYDVLDLGALCAVGLGVAVANAHVTVKAAAGLVTARSGGRGAVREVAELVLRAIGSDTPSDRCRSDFGVIIPARMASTRLPGKPLLDLAGKPMIVRVVENAFRSRASFVRVATDDERVARVVAATGAEAVMTASDHTTGTDRIAEVVDRLELSGDTIVVNVQGDEPLLDPTLIDRVAAALAFEPEAEVATLATPIRDLGHVHDPNVVKVIVNQLGLAVAFSRAPIPWVRDVFTQPPEPGALLPRTTTFLRHVGIYAYRVAALRRFAAHPPVALEKAEALEQLRMLWLDIAIRIGVVDEAPAHGVDTPADLAAAERALRGANSVETTPGSRPGAAAGSVESTRGASAGSVEPTPGAE